MAADTANLAVVQVEKLALAGSWLFTPRIHRDGRGLFLESFKQELFKGATGHLFDVQQLNISQSHQGTIRGIHYADVPPGQAKYVQCLAGSILDVIVDLRVGSETFGQWQGIELNSDLRQAVYLSEGLGHAFCALSDTVTVGYMCSAAYAPATEHEINPLDVQLQISWPHDLNLKLSAKDAAAPSLAEALESGILPTWNACQARSSELRDGLS